MPGEHVVKARAKIARLKLKLGKGPALRRQLRVVTASVIGSTLARNGARLEDIDVSGLTQEEADGVMGGYLAYLASRVVQGAS